MDLEMKLVLALWGLLALVWGTNSLSTKPVMKAQSAGSRAFQTTLLACSFLLLCGQTVGISWLDHPVFQHIVWMPWAGVGTVAIGVGLAIWARMVLGSNWSGTAMLKVGHAFIACGPYRIVRHPIYSGILAAVLGTAVVRGTIHALLAVPFCILSYFLKLRTEEDLLISQFGHDYLQYRRQVKALIPFLL
jgi:protein-S-isoprenylcysteine O-methyltransferase Ste14